MPSILVVCNANQFRSPFVESYLRHRLSTRSDFSDWQVSSAGVWAENGLPIGETLEPIVRTFGLQDLFKHRSRLITAEIIQAADLVIVMESGQKESLGLEFPAMKSRIFLLSELSEPIAYDIPDPAFQRMDTMELAREMADLVDRGLDRCVKLAQG